MFYTEGQDGPGFPNLKFSFPFLKLLTDPAINFPNPMTSESDQIPIYMAVSKTTILRENWWG